MKHTPEEPFNRQNDPEYVRMIVHILNAKMDEMFAEDTDPMVQLLETDALIKAGFLAINPHSDEAFEDWQHAQDRLEARRQAHPASPSLYIVGEDG